MNRRIVSLLVVLVLAAGCGDDGGEGYSDETEAQFMASCVASVQEGEESLCECIYDGMANDVPFDEFKKLDRRLSDDPDAELPEDVNALVMECATEKQQASTTTVTAAPTTPTTQAP